MIDTANLGDLLHFPAVPAIERLRQEGRLEILQIVTLHGTVIVVQKLFVQKHVWLTQQTLPLIARKFPVWCC